MRWIRRCAANCWVLLFCATLLPAQDSPAPHGKKKEEIFVIRSVRTARITPTDYCAQFRTGFSDVLYEDQYDFYAVATDAQHGAIVSTLGNKTASLHACFGKAPDPNVLNFYGEGEIAAISFTGNGKCMILKRDFPEPGLKLNACFLHLGGVKDPYIGGLLTTNTLITRNTLGEKSDPPGYVQPSIATVRLWKNP
jgi:hypothetical protein